MNKEKVKEQLDIAKAIEAATYLKKFCANNMCVICPFDSTTVCTKNAPALWDLKDFGRNLYE